jgi:hypothetical protein
MHWLGVVSLVRPTVNGVGIWRDAWSGRGISSNSSLPCLLKQERGCTSSIFGSNDTPERRTVRLVNVAKTLLVDIGDVQWDGGNIAVKTKRRVCCRVGKSTAGRRRLGKNGNWVAESSRGAV